MKIQEKLERIWDRSKRTVFFFSGAIAILLLASGIWKVTHSPIFIIQNVEIIDLPPHSPVDALTVQKWLGITPGTIGLFDLNLAEVETRVLQNKSQSNWVQKIQLFKTFPHTLLVKVEFRKPVAFFQFPSGSLTYLDENGVTFGQVTLSMNVELPIFSGFDPRDSTRIKEGLYLNTLWAKQGLDREYPISTLMFDSDRGYRVLTSYRMHTSQSSPSSGVTTSTAGKPAAVSQNPVSKRPVIDLGFDVRDAQFETQLGRISQVLEYLSVKGVSARQILGDSGKKIIVRRGN